MPPCGSKEAAEFCREKRHRHDSMYRTTPFLNPATARTAGSCERIGATKAPVLSPAIPSIGRFTPDSGGKLCFNDRHRLSSHSADKGCKLPLAVTVPPCPYSLDTAPHTAKQGLFSLSPPFGPRAAQSGSGLPPGSPVIRRRRVRQRRTGALLALLKSRYSFFSPVLCKLHSCYLSPNRLK